LEIVARLRTQLRTLSYGYRQKIVGIKGISVVASDEPGVCPMCSGKWHVQKSTIRKGKTLAHGQFEARQTVHMCKAGCRDASGARVTRGASSLSKALIPHSVAGYDVMAFVGQERFLRNSQREEIREKLAHEYGLEISSGEVSHLSRLFLNYLERLHRSSSDKLREAIERDGGWPMHVDATGEDGRGTLLVVMDGWRGWVLGAWKPSTERSDLILPCLQEIVQRFGMPCAVVRDLGQAVTLAVEDLLRGAHQEVPVLACHLHFLADIGRDLLDPSHSALRNQFRRTKIRPQLRTFARDLGRRVGESSEQTRRRVLAWQKMIGTTHLIPGGKDGLAITRALAQWILDYHAQTNGFGFPFDRPYLDFYERCLTALHALDSFLLNPPQDRSVMKALRRLRRILDPVACDIPFRSVSRRLRRRAVLFDELRATLRLTAIEPPKDETPQDLEAMRCQIGPLIESMEQRRTERGTTADTKEAIDLIFEHLVNHSDYLWGHAISLPECAGGGVRLVKRTNNLLENFFGLMKHAERRRSGRKNLTHDLEQLPAQAALVKNLNDPDYVNIVCGTLDRLPEAFAQLDSEQHCKSQKDVFQQNADNLSPLLQIESASLSIADRTTVRTEAMNERIRAAAGSRATLHCLDLCPCTWNPTEL